MWEGKQVIGFLLTWRLLQHQLQQQTKDKYIISSCYSKLNSCFMMDPAGHGREVESCHVTELDDWQRLQGV